MIASLIWIIWPLWAFFSELFCYFKFTYYCKFRRTHVLQVHRIQVCTRYILCTWYDVHRMYYVCVYPWYNALYNAFLVTPNLDTPDPSESGVTSSSTDYPEIRSDGQKRGPESFPEPITPPDSDTAISPHKTIHLAPNQASAQSYNGMNQSVMLQSHANGPIMTTSNEMVNYDWSAPGFSSRSLGETDDASWFNNNVKDQKTSDISKRSEGHFTMVNANQGKHNPKFCQT